MKVIKITNALWLSQIAPKINDFNKKLKVPGLTYEGLLTYYQQSVQFGGEMLEFWVVFDGVAPVAFAHWMAKAIPYTGTVYLDAIYNWTKQSEPVKLLAKEFHDFGVNRNALIYEANVINDRIFRIFRKYVAKYGIAMEKTTSIQVIGRRNENIQ